MPPTSLDPPFLLLFSFLSHKKGKHEAMRKIKNEFMTHWDGLVTKPGERILVLAATNRSFDLDEAIIKHFERRMVQQIGNHHQLLLVVQASSNTAPVAIRGIHFKWYDRFFLSMIAFSMYPFLFELKFGCNGDGLWSAAKRCMFSWKSSDSIHSLCGGLSFSLDVEYYGIYMVH
ncbi:hypothetical protein L6452_08729 [Arctium lappa]|uniref:Uncharacterized protein n=1 Tax=Arctium lappa TaxID=4217 RepID=A0ACB9DIA5_ARCLA|nr:hypothetical protein L6452_08729 [Arctium lappa]